jgi:tRNA pseudouridine38-40 synthase
MRVASRVEYDGTHYWGWQLQPDALMTVQGQIEAALSKLYHVRIPVMASGRTDAGVHALNQCIHFDIPDARIKIESLPKALNSMLPKDIVMLAAQRVEADFHARFSAMHRSYVYHIFTCPTALYRNTVWQTQKVLDFDLLKQGAIPILGIHDFSSFCSSKTDTKNMMCNITTSEWIQTEDGFDYHIAGNRFLHHMVRLLVGCMIEISRHKLSIDKIKHFLDNPDKQSNVVKAAATGLVLKTVEYPESMNLKI